MRTYAVYILTNRSGTLYAGMTSELGRRLAEHRSFAVPGFTAKYRLDRLVHVELYSTPREAMARERQLKGWRRSKKVALIEAHNPAWADLAAHYLQQDDRVLGQPRRWAHGLRRGMPQWSPAQNPSTGSDETPDYTA